MQLQEHNKVKETDRNRENTALRGGKKGGAEKGEKDQCSQQHTYDGSTYFSSFFSLLSDVFVYAS